MGDTPNQPRPALQNWTRREMYEVASRALGLILRDDIRGLTLVGVDGIAAMAGVLVEAGLVPTLPGDPSPAALIHLPAREVCHDI